jgi:membrane protein
MRKAARQGTRIESHPDHAASGRLAATPVGIPWRGWKQLIGRTWREISSDRVSLVAAGCAFYATLALFPAISMLVSLYGMVFDPKTVEPQLQTIRELLPPAAFTLIADLVHTLVSHGSGTLGLSLLISSALALWSASTGTKSLLSALNLIYGEAERRGFLRFQAIGLAMTLCAVLGATLGVAILVGLPAAVSFLGISAHAGGLIRLGSLAVLGVFMLLALALLYRFGPARQNVRWHWITPGSLMATALWFAASALFSFYVAHVASYDAIYGPLGAVVGVMMWFWVSAYLVLLGAELNAELELQTTHNVPEGKPKRRRGGFV